jgi:hypothetical protein
MTTDTKDSRPSAELAKAMALNRDRMTRLYLACCEGHHAANCVKCDVRLTLGEFTRGAWCDDCLPGAGLQHG